MSHSSIRHTLRQAKACLALLISLQGALAASPPVDYSAFVLERPWLGSDDPLVLDFLAAVRLELGQLHEAEGLLNEALLFQLEQRIDGGAMTRLCERLAQLHHRQGNPSTAILFAKLATHTLVMQKREMHTREKAMADHLMRSYSGLRDQLSALLVATGRAGELANLDRAWVAGPGHGALPLEFSSAEQAVLDELRHLHAAFKDFSQQILAIRKADPAPSLEDASQQLMIIADARRDSRERFDTLMRTLEHRLEPTLRSTEG